MIILSDYTGYSIEVRNQIVYLLHYNLEIAAFDNNTVCNGSILSDFQYWSPEHTAIETTLLRRIIKYYQTYKERI